jgi:LPXTG-motif cell wall-anchored protein
MSLRSRPLSLTLAAAVLVTGLGVVAPPAATAAPDTGGLTLDGSGSALLTAETEEIAPGLDLTSFRRSQPTGWVSGHVLVADLSTPTLSMDVLDSGTVSGGATVTEQIAGTGAVAAVNGDYFDINASGAPVGTNVSSEGVRSITATPRSTFTVADGVAAVRALGSAATATFGGATSAVRAVNAPSLPAGELGWYTSAWGAHPLARPLGGPGTLPDPVARASVVDGVVTAVTTDPASVAGPTAIAAGEGVLLGRGASAAKIAALVPGDRVDVQVSVDADVDLAVGGSERLLTDGAPAELGTVDASRTAVGISRDGTTIWIVSIEGRQADAKGMTITEIGEFLRDLGAWNAVNLDGGGSSALLAREPGTSEAALVNRPSDGTERVVANSLAFFSSAPTGTVEDVRVEPALDRDGADRVIPGLGRTIAGIGLDAARGGVAVDGVFESRDDAVTVSATDGDTARVTGATPGAASVSFHADGRTGTLPLRVLGELERVRPSATVVPLPDPASTALLTLEGLDRDGFAAPIEASDVTVEAGPDVTVTPTGLDGFLIAPATDSGAATVTFTVAGVSVDVAVTVGYRTQSIADFSDGAAWTSAHARAPGGVLTTATGPDGAPALDLRYDFTQDTGTRGFYAIVPEALPGRVIDGQPQALTLWVNGDGSGVWPRIQMVTGAGTTINLDGPNITWTGWQQARFTVPAGTQYPLTLQRIRFMETRAAASYQGHLQISGLEAVVPPTVDQPQSERVHDAVIVTDGTVDDRAQRIAVMSDSQFIAGGEQGDIVAAARRTLQEIKVADPDLLVINGDFVDEAHPADFALARSILDEELAGTDFPFVYVPGNHEVMGGAIANFEAAFGATRQAVRLGDTLVVTLNSSSGSLRGSDAAQLRWFDEQLAAAARDGGITGVIVFAHHPADDPLPSKASQLGDRTEAAAFTARLAEFRADTGKSIAAVNAHVGMFHATSTDGVSRLINGNSGKSPSSTPANGGFTGWTMLGVDPDSGVVGSTPTTVDARISWMRAETHARVDELALDAPTVIEVGETVSVSATLTQDGGREVPVAWPVSADWAGEGVVVGESSAALERAAGALRLNPATGELTGTTEGSATLTVTVNGVTEEVAVRVIPNPDAPVDPGPVDPGPGDPGPVDPGPGPVDPGPGEPEGEAPAAVLPPSDDASSEGALPRTGSEAPWPLIAGGAGMLLAGAVAIVLVRRRRNA